VALMIGCTMLSLWLSRSWRAEMTWRPAIVMTKALRVYALAFAVLNQVYRPNVRCE
jgi:hypothetical protein